MTSLILPHYLKFFPYIPVLLLPKSFPSLHTMSKGNGRQNANIHTLENFLLWKLKVSLGLLKFFLFLSCMEVPSLLLCAFVFEASCQSREKYQTCWNAACSCRRRCWLGKSALQPSEISSDQIPKANNFSSLRASAGPFQHLLDSKWLELSCTKAGLSYYRHLYCGYLWVCVSWKPGFFRMLLGQKGIKMARVLLNLNWCLIEFLSLFSLSPLSLWPTLTPAAVFVQYLNWAPSASVGWLCSHRK